MRSEQQWSDRATGRCDRWGVRTTREGYDEHGEIVFSETTSQGFTPSLPDWDIEAGEDWGDTEDGGHPDDVYVVEDSERVEAVEVSDYIEGGEGLYLNVFQNIYEGGRLVRSAAYKVSLDFSETSMDRTCKYEWVDERLARYDCFDSRGEWHESKVFTWSGDLLRIDWFEPPSESATASFSWLSPPADDLTTSYRTEIYQRRGPRAYVRLYESPNTHWEYSSENGIETVSKFVGELIVERSRLAMVEGERRPLTVEQLAPDRVGLVTVEQWDWSAPDRVIVERADGRDVYMLDCSGLPPTDSLIDPDCPPPRPIR